jgi:hypothetical protein
LGTLQILVSRKKSTIFFLLENHFISIETVNRHFFLFFTQGSSFIFCNIPGLITSQQAVAFQLSDRVFYQFVQGMAE